MKKKIFEIILGALIAFVIFFMVELQIHQHIYNTSDIVAILKNIPWQGIGLTGVILIILTIVKEKKK